MCNIIIIIIIGIIICTCCYYTISKLASPSLLLTSPSQRIVGVKLHTINFTFLKPLDSLNDSELLNRSFRLLSGVSRRWTVLCNWLKSFRGRLTTRLGGFPWPNLNACQVLAPAPDCLTKLWLDLCEANKRCSSLSTEVLAWWLWTKPNINELVNGPSPPQPTHSLSLSDIFNQLDCTQEKYYFKYNFVNSLTNLDRIRLLLKVGLAALHFVRTKVPSSLCISFRDDSES